MSALVVGHDHIDLLVSAVTRWDVRASYRPAAGGPTRAVVAEDCGGDPTTLGRLLLRENLRSLTHRYGHGRDNLVDDPVTVDELGADLRYRHRPVPPGLLDPVHVLKAAQCYAYQACEHPGWDGSAAAALTQALQQGAISRLPGYAEAPWLWTRARVNAR